MRKKPERRREEGRMVGEAKIEERRDEERPGKNGKRLRQSYKH